MVKKTPLSLSEVIALEGLILLTQGTPLPLIYHLQNPLIEYESKEITALEGILSMKREIETSYYYKIRIPYKNQPYYKKRENQNSCKNQPSYKIRIPKPEVEIKFNPINKETVVKRKHTSKILYCDIKECRKPYKSENGLKYHKRTKHN